MTETDAVGTSTTQVFTGQTMSRNGGPQAEATGTFVVTTCGTGTTSCSASLQAASQLLSATGKKIRSATARIEEQVSSEILACAHMDYRAEVATLTDSGLESGSTISVTDTVKGLPSVTGVQVCYQPVGGSPPPPKTLPHCKHNGPKEPCLQSETESKGSVVAKVLLLPGDPRFHVGPEPSVVTSFSPASAAPGKKVTIKGTNLANVTGVTIGQKAAKIDTRAATKLTVTVPTGAQSGAIVVTSQAGVATSKTAFKVT